MRLIFDDRIKTFSITSALSVIIVLLIQLFLNRFGIGFSFGEVIDNLYIILFVYIVWIFLFSLARGWIRLAK